MQELAEQLAAALALNTQQTSMLDDMTAKAAQLEAAVAKTAPELSKANSAVGQLTAENRDLQLAARKLELRAQVYTCPSMSLRSTTAPHITHWKGHGKVGG
jgi:predicted double-glycine peptidase